MEALYYPGFLGRKIRIFYMLLHEFKIIEIVGQFATKFFL
jgi:hypothetical protein